MKQEQMELKSEKIYQKGSELTVNGISFDDPDLAMLVLEVENIEEHLMKQPAACAYFGHLYKLAERDYDDLKKSWEMRQKEMYSECSAELGKTQKRPTINDVEGLALSKHKAEMEDFNKRLMKKREVCDNLEMYYEAWKQKSFMINTYANLIVSGFLSKSDIGTNDFKSDFKKGVSITSLREQVRKDVEEKLK